MIENFEKLKIFYSDLRKVSNLTQTKGKKLKLIILGFFVNIVAALDILIILYFSSFFSLDFELTYFKFFFTSIFCNF